MKKILALLLALSLALGLLSACGGGSDKSGDTQGASSSEVTPPEPVYSPNRFTGEELTADDPVGVRPVAIMLNNIRQAFPQSGLAQADLVYEIVTEGGITRLMCVFSDYTTMPKVGPVRSARDQHVQLAMGLGAMYMHIGGSQVALDMLKNYEYNNREIDFKYNSNYLTFDSYRHDTLGKDTEHCWYLDGENLTQAVENLSLDTSTRSTSTVFAFVPYDESPRVLEGGDSTAINVKFSSYATTTFDYLDGKYYKSEFGEPQMDANLNEQVGFKNVLIIFAPMEYYPNSNLTHVDYAFGGVGYYFCNGRYEQVRWLKGNADMPLRIVDMGGNELDVKLNVGNTYVGVVSLDEYESFSY